ncbi:MAG: ABC transporter permease, partial [Lysobacter sp.]
RITGVLDHWRPTPKFYDMNASSGYGAIEQVFVPFTTSRDLKLSRSGSMDCWESNDDNDDPEGNTGINANCVWVQYWVQLDSAEEAAAYRQYLVNYSDQQRAGGRYERPTNVRLRNVMEWLDHNKVVPGDVRLQVWLAFGFLLVCLLNTVGLLLAKFLRRSGEIGVRRALGASRRAIFMQCLVEAGTVGLAGGVLGLALAWLGLWAVRQQPHDYADLAHLDPAMLVTTFVLAVAASLLAGLLPAWQAMQVTPAMQLKSH